MTPQAPKDTLVSGFVLAGGESRRMGQNKALLEYQGGTLFQWIAAQVSLAAGNVTVLGDPLIYRKFGLPVVEDFHKGCGPIGGLHAALTTMNTGRCLLVACDLPNINASFLRHLIDHAVVPKVLAAEDDNGLQPLCAVYHRDCLPEVENAIAEGRLKMRSLAKRLHAKGVPAVDDLIQNVNTPEQWAALSLRRSPAPFSRTQS